MMYSKTVQEHIKLQEGIELREVFVLDTSDGTAARMDICIITSSDLWTATMNPEEDGTSIIFLKLFGLSDLQEISEDYFAICSAIVLSSIELMP